MSEGNNHRDEIFSKKVRAGHRTYFFDVKTTKSNEYYVTITESKKRNGDDGSPFYEKHKIFLYQEDFQNFLDAYNEVFQRINELSDGQPITQRPTHESPRPDIEVKAYTPVVEKKDEPSSTSSFTDVSFDDLK